MIKFENTEVVGWKAAIRTMRNPTNSQDESDSEVKLESWHDTSGGKIEIGPNDLNLMKCLIYDGVDHRDFMKAIIVYVDITAPLYWWSGFGIAIDSDDIMSKLMEKEITLDGFSHEHLFCDNVINLAYQKNDFRAINNEQWLMFTIDILNSMREAYLKSAGVVRKKYWWQMVQLLPSSYNHKQTITLSYETLANIYKSKKYHTLDDWCEHKPIIDPYLGFCDWIHTLPYSELITGLSSQEMIMYADNNPFVTPNQVREAFGFDPRPNSTSKDFYGGLQLGMTDSGSPVFMEDTYNALTEEQKDTIRKAICEGIPGGVAGEDVRVFLNLDDIDDINRTIFTRNMKWSSMKIDDTLCIDVVSDSELTEEQKDTIRNSIKPEYRPWAISFKTRGRVKVVKTEQIIKEPPDSDLHLKDIEEIMEKYKIESELNRFAGTATITSIKPLTPEVEDMFRRMHAAQGIRDVTFKFRIKEE